MGVARRVDEREELHPDETGHSSQLIKCFCSPAEQSGDAQRPTQRVSGMSLNFLSEQPRRIFVFVCKCVSENEGGEDS